MNMLGYLKASFVFLILVPLTVGCAKGVQFGIGQTSESFTQKGGIVQNNLDILFVVDNSGSMAPLQADMTSNFQSFIGTFQAKGYDFRIATTATDAYKANKNFVGYTSANDSLALFQDGACCGSPSNVFVIIPSTPNLDATFVTNATTGIQGSGDERAFSSMMTSLDDTSNPAFLRTNSFLAIIILSDEDDFSNYSRPEGSWGSNVAEDHCYYDKNMDTAATTAYSGPNHVSTCKNLSPQTPPDTIQTYISALDNLTQSTGTSRRWSVSTIAVLDSTCQLSHSQTDSASFVSVIGQRYIQLSQATQGIQGSICDPSYANSLSAIASQITALSTQFYLDRIPQPSTIAVYVNSSLVPQDPNNGWSYNSGANAIQFHGDATPPQNATINVTFTPVSIGS